jgi:hypothetical protein
MTVYVADALAHIQRVVSVVKMATVLQDVLPTSSILLCVLGVKGLNAKDIYKKKCYLFTAGSVCRGSQLGREKYIFVFVSGSHDCA